MQRILHRVLGLLLGLAATLTFALAQPALAGGRQEAALLTAMQVLKEIQGMPDQRMPDYLLARAYGIAIIPDVTKVAFIFGGRRGHGVLVVRDSLNAPWSNPVLVTLTGGSWGFQAGAQSSDIVLVFTTKAGVEGIAGGKLTLGADASVATGPVGRQTSAGTDITLDSEVYSYARTRGLFGGLAIDGSVISIDRAGDAELYEKADVTTSEILSAQSPPAPPSAQRFQQSLAEATRSARSSAPEPAATPAPGSATNAPDAAPAPARTYPLEAQPLGVESQPPTDK